MSEFDAELESRLRGIREAGLHRSLRTLESAQGTRVAIEGREVLNFSSNDYLGLANHPLLKEAAASAASRFGAGSGSARLICGSLEPHGELEREIAAFKGAEAALVFSSGYAAAMGALGALLDREDVVVLDKRAHACLVDGARLCGAKMRVFPHNDLESLSRILEWSGRRQQPAGSGRKPRVLIVTESIFSMDGDAAPLREIVEIKEKHGAWLMLDEAHATGWLGPGGRGGIEEFGLQGRVEIQMGTLGKALGSSGGYICGSRALIEYLVNRARSFIFSTAPVPAASASALAGLRIVQSEEGLRLRGELRRAVARAHGSLCRLGRGLPQSGVGGPIIPWVFGPESRAVEAAGRLLEHGILLPAVRFPTVPRGQARLRIALTAQHADTDCDRLARALEEVTASLAQ